MIELITFDYVMWLGLILLGALLFFLIVALIDSLLTDRGLRDLMKIAQTNTILQPGDKLILALAYHRLGMKQTLKLLNGVYEDTRHDPQDSSRD